MKKILPGLLLALPILLLTLLTVSRLSAQSPGVTLSGSVRDSATGKPIPGVSVFLNSTSKGTVTHDDGNFALYDIPPGRYQIIVSAIGYATLAAEINYTPPSSVIKDHPPYPGIRTRRGDR